LDTTHYNSPASSTANDPHIDLIYCVEYATAQIARYLHWPTHNNSTPYFGITSDVRAEPSELSFTYGKQYGKEGSGRECVRDRIVRSPPAQVSIGARAISFRV
jgi:hypothetical protein